MRGVVLAAAAYSCAVSAGPAQSRRCSRMTRQRSGAASRLPPRSYRLPPAVLVILLNVEGGSLGRVSPNTNGTVDIGPMQVNEIWLPERRGALERDDRSDAYKALRDNFCANVEAGAWILRRGLDEARGDFWEGVGYYHSHDARA